MTKTCNYFGQYPLFYSSDEHVGRWRQAQKPYFPSQWELISCVWRDQFPTCLSPLGIQPGPLAQHCKTSPSFKSNLWQCSVVILCFNSSNPFTCKYCYYLFLEIKIISMHNRCWSPTMIGISRSGTSSSCWSFSGSPSTTRRTLWLPTSSSSRADSQ